jgi:hypothetical protein
MTLSRPAALLVVPIAIVAWSAACDSTKPVDSWDQSPDTAPGNDPARDSSDTPDPGGGGGGGGGGGSEPNTAPRANAGGDQTGKQVGDTVFLDGTGSQDADGDQLSYAWSFHFRPSTSSATIANATFATAQATLDKPGDYLIKLTVTDERGLSDEDLMEVEVAAPNTGPVADAGIDQRVSLGQLVQLSGISSSDPDGDPLEFRWSFAVRPPGSVAQLSGDQTSSPRFTADVTGTFTVQLVVSDGEDSSPPDLVTVAVDDPQTAGGGGGDSEDCLGCTSEDAARRFGAGDAANGALIGALPLLALLLERRRRLR